MNWLVFLVTLMSPLFVNAHDGGASESILHFLFAGHHGAIGIFIVIACLYAFVRRAVKRPDLSKPLENLARSE